MSQAEVRVKEATRLGFKRCLLPKQNEQKVRGVRGMELIGITSVQEVMKILFK